jgi:hypothetical protein
MGTERRRKEEGGRRAKAAAVADDERERYRDIGRGKQKLIRLEKIE